MAEYNVDIQVRAKTQQVESQLTKLQQRLDQLAGAASRIDFGTPERALRRVGNTARTVGTEIRNVFSRGLFAGAVLGAGQLSTSITDVISKFGFLGKSAAGSINSALGGVPELVGSILNQIGHIPNAMGLAAVAAMAFAPQLLKASSAAVGLGAAVDKAVGKQVTENIAGVIGQVNGLKTAVDNTKTSFADLIKGSTLNQLNAQLKDARHQIGEYHSSTQQAVTAASQLVAVTRAQAVEQRAINDLVRQASGITQTELEESKAVKSLKTKTARTEFYIKQQQELKDLQVALLRLEIKSAGMLNKKLEQEGALAAITARGVNAKKFQVALAKAEGKQALMLPAFQERGLKLLDNSIKLNESNLRIEQALNGERARGVRFLEKQSAEEARQVKLGILGQRSMRLPGSSGIQAGPFPVEGPMALARFGGKRGLRMPSISGKRLGGAVSGGLIGGAFPLLFGQGGGAAAGGAIGGFLGGLAGPGGSFAGSLVGTLLGDIASRGQKVKELAQDIGFSAQQTQLLANAFKVANTDLEKFTAVIQNVRGLGIEIDDQAKAIKLITTLADKYGGSFEKVGNAITSALESGKVGQGTLNQLTSQGIDIQSALASKYKVSRDAILTMAKDGDISVQDLIDTLVDMGNKGTDAAKRPKSAMDNLRDSISKLSDAVTALASNFVAAFGPVFKWLTDRVTDFINAVSRAISRLSDLMQGGRMTQATLFAERAAQTATQQKFGVFGRLTKEGSAFYETQKQAELKKLVPGAFTPAKTPKLETFKAPSQFVPSETAKGSKAAAANAAAALEKRINKLKEEAALSMRTAEIKAKIRQAEIAGDSQLVLRLKYEEARAKIISDTEKALVGIKDLREQDSLIIARNAELYALVRNYEYDIVDLQKQSADLLPETLSRIEGLASGYSSVLEYSQRFTKEQEQQKQMADGLANAIGQGMGSAFDDLILGTEAFGDSLRRLASGVLTDIARQLLQIYVINQAINAISTIFSPKPGGTAANTKFNPAAFAMPQLAGARANGGSVSAGSSYLVGERGPELFVPGASGNIVPNNAMGGSNIVVNVDATGSSVQGNGDESKRLGEAIGIAIRQELIKQKRPGGLLA